MASTSLELKPESKLNRKIPRTGQVNRRKEQNMGYAKLVVHTNEGVKMTAVEPEGNFTEAKVYTFLKTLPSFDGYAVVPTAEADDGVEVVNINGRPF